MSDITHEDAPLSADAALALLKNQQRTVTNERGSFVFSITLSWTVVWLVGFLALWSVDGLPGHGLSLAVAMSIFIVLLVAAIVVSIVQGVRGRSGIRGSGSGGGAFTGTVYGVSWSIVMIAIAAIGAALRAHGMSPMLGNIYYPCTYTFAVGLLYLMAGGIWHSVSSVVAGGCVILVAVIAAWIGYPGHFLALAIGGGGTFLVLAVWEAISTRRIRRAVFGGAPQHG